MKRSLALAVAMLVIGSVLVAVPGTSVQAADGTGPAVNITLPAPNAILNNPVVTVTWTNSIPAEERRLCLVQLDADPVQEASSHTGHVFEGVSEGYHTIRVWAYSLTAVQPAYDSLNFIVDLSNPALSIAFPANDAKLNSSAVNATWSASDLSYISSFEVRLDGGSWEVLPPSATHKVLEELAEGPHTFIVVAHDMAGKTTTQAVSFTVDTVPPTVRITAPENGTGFDHDDVTVGWTGSDDRNLKGYQVWVDGVMKSFTAPAWYTDTRDYADGYHTITIVAVDQAGNTDSGSVTFYVDTTELDLIAHGPLGDNEAIDAPITVQFSKEMDRTATSIAVSGVAGNVEWGDDGRTATFAPSSSLSYGTSYTVTLAAQDLVGNTKTYSWTFTITDQGTISGIVRDNNGNPLSGAKVTLDGGEPVTTDETGVFSFQASAGTHELKMTKSGWDPRTVKIDLAAGEEIQVSDLSLTPSSILGLLGIVAAAIAVVIVGALYYFGRHRRKDRRPPAAPRSWKGMSELQKRAARSSRRIEDDDEFDRL